MNKKNILIVISILITALLAGCQPTGNSLFPPEKNREVILKPTALIFIKESPTNISLGDVGAEYTFGVDTLTVKGEENTTYEITYDKTELTKEEFAEQLPKDDDFPDISSYKNIERYDLYKATKDSPGYRLYILDKDTYWIATLYNQNIWRITEINDNR